MADASCLAATGTLAGSAFNAFTRYYLTNLKGNLVQHRKPLVRRGQLHIRQAARRGLLVVIM